MANDAYQPCPFCTGTDRKRKFCCNDIAEDMEKVARLSESGQSRSAMKILERLAQSHPDTVWNEATRATLLLGEGRAAEARAILETLFAAAPENPAVIGLLATAALAADGYAAAKEPVWRAFRKATGFADLVSGLAMTVAAEQFDRGKYLSARQHLTLAMRLAPPRDQQAIFVRLLEFDGNAEIPCPLRSVHSLRDVAGDADRQDAARKAMRLAERGCFGQAAERFAHLLQETPDDPALEYDFALCRAWEGDEEIAAEAFGRASRCEPDFELAAEYAALEQLLRHGADDARVLMKNAEYRIESASRLISTLDDHPRFVRLTLPPEAAGAAGVPDAVFELLDRPLPESVSNETDPTGLPRAVGQLAVFGAPEDADEPRAAIAAFEGGDYDAATALLAEAAPGLHRIEERIEPGDASLPREIAPLHARTAYPDKTPVRLRRTLERRRWDAAIDRLWRETPQAALDGKTPAQAAHDDRLRVPLAGAVHVLDAYCLQARYPLDLNGLRRSLGLPEVAPLEPRPGLNLNQLSAIQLHRLDVAKLEDRQLTVVLNRSLLVHHGGFLAGLIEEALRRSLPDVDKNRLYLTLVDLARDRGDQEGALRWTEEGRKAARSGDQAFENVFRWDTKELGLRLEDPSDPEVGPFVRRMASYYGPKVPRFSESLAQLLRAYDIPEPSVLEPAGAAAGGSGGLWTPDQPAGGEKKLWLPGT